MTTVLEDSLIYNFKLNVTWVIIRISLKLQGKSYVGTTIYLIFKLSNLPHGQVDLVRNSSGGWQFTVNYQVWTKLFQMKAENTQYARYAHARWSSAPQMFRGGRSYVWKFSDATYMRLVASTPPLYHSGKYTNGRAYLWVYFSLLIIFKKVWAYMFWSIFSIKFVKFRLMACLSWEVITTISFQMFAQFSALQGKECDP